MVKLLFFGTPTFAIPTLQRLIHSDHTVVAVVTQPDRPRGRGKIVSASPVKKLACRHSIPVLQPERLRDSTLVSQLTKLDIDLGIVAAYGKILTEKLLALPRLGMINVHASLLPKYRGAAPIHRAVIAGETETGITIIKLVKEMDAGPILQKAKHQIGPKDRSDLLEQDLANLGSKLLMNTVEKLITGQISEEEQDHALATFAPKLTKNDGIISWGEKATAIHNLVRGLSPWPHAFSYLNSNRYLILKTFVAENLEKTVKTNQPIPGQIIEAVGDRFVVAAGFGTRVSILEIQPEGKRPQSARTFLSGHSIEPGSIFQSNLS